MAQRTSEIAIRMALSANRGKILRMILGETARLVAIGIAAGVAITLAGARLVDSLLFGVTSTVPRGARGSRVGTALRAENPKTCTRHKCVDLRSYNGSR